MTHDVQTEQAILAIVRTMRGHVVMRSNCRAYPKGPVLKCVLFDLNRTVPVPGSKYDWNRMSAIVAVSETWPEMLAQLQAREAK